MTTLAARAETQEGQEAIARWAQAKLAKRSLAAFVQLAVAAGELPGITKIEWGPHLDAICLHTQLMLEGWLVAYGLGTAEMIDRQRCAWERTGAVWEDGAPEPWLRYVLVQNMIKNLPPGTFKSTIDMVCANAWVWLHAPGLIFGASSGVDANVTRDSNATRDLIKSTWYRETFGIAWETIDLDEDGMPVKADIGVRSDVDAVNNWATTAGGRRYSRTWQRGFTGLHVDALFGDDADDADRVWNEPARKATQNKWTNAMETRVNDEHRSLRVILQQVVHHDGMSAYLLSIARWSPQNPKGWARLCIAAEFGMGPADAPIETPYGWRDWRTFQGETMHPRLSPGVLADKRLKLPGYEGQYNQNPDRHTDGMFRRGHARFFVWEGTNVDVLRKRPLGCPSREEQPPVVIKRGDLTQLTLSVDAANSLDVSPGKKRSAVGLVVGGCRLEERYIVDDRTRMLGVSGTYRAIYELIGVWMLERVLVELKALGAGVVSEIDRAIKRGWYIDDETEEKVELLGPDGKRPRCVVETFQPGKEDKVQRAHGMLPTWQQGLLFMLDGAHWLYPQTDSNRQTVDEGYMGEIGSFPQSRRNDRVDATSQFIARYRGENDTRTQWQAMRRLGMIGTRR